MRIKGASAPTWPSHLVGWSATTNAHVQLPPAAAAAGFNSWSTRHPQWGGLLQSASQLTSSHPSWPARQQLATHKEAGPTPVASSPECCLGSLSPATPFALPPLPPLCCFWSHGSLRYPGTGRSSMSCRRMNAWVRACMGG